MPNKSNSNKLILEEKYLLKHLGNKFNIPYVDLDEIEINIESVKYVNEKIAHDNKIMPVDIKNNTLFIAVSDPLDLQPIDDIKITTGMQTEILLSSKKSIEMAIMRYYKGNANKENAEKAIIDFNKTIKLDNIDSKDNKESANSLEVESAPIVRLVNSILSDAINMKSSDVHVEPFENEVRVRLRVDGELREIMKLPRSILSGIITRIKIISSLDIAETKKPQDGRSKLNINNKVVNLRISLIPTVYGEKAVIRILNKDEGVMDISEICASESNLTRIKKLMKISEGIILLTGPTGSGKTSTLYSILKDFNTINKNIITLEDPIEYQMSGINQVQVNTKVGMTFASGLRSILRQDPDIIMLGEIRDEETAHIAIRAAVTGHIVLSTLHTNDTVSSIIRLTDMGIPKYMVTSAVSGIVAQRLVKKNCYRCAKEYYSSEYERNVLGLERSILLKKGEGCMFCNGTGYSGRTAIHEVLVLEQNIKNMINRNCSSEEIKSEVIRNGMKTLSESAKELVILGITTVDEMVRATYII